MKNLKKEKGWPPMTKSAHLDIDVSALSGVTQDSRAVQAGYLFAALKGEKSNGEKYIPEVLKKGASVILVDEAYQTDGDFGDAKLIKSANPRKDFSYITADFHAKQPGNIVTVTGTNGKSSTVYFANQLWAAIEESATFIGTLNNNLTTPDPVSLFETLAQMADDGISHVALEASSHGLSQYRMDGANITVAAFTNLSQDHLDYHDTMETYFTAKARLFEELLPLNGVAVLNADIPEFHVLSGICKKRGLRILSYGRQAKDIVLNECTVDGLDYAISIEVLGRSFDVKVPLIGEFQIMNLLCALACVIAEDHSNERRVNKLINALSKIDGVPGRLQHVTDPGGIYHGYVDYAHTPDALKTVLGAIRPHVKGRIITVFGCGGDRDQSKRPQMGAITAELSDVTIITDDNPRTEDAGTIRDHIMAGIKGGDETQVDVIEGRRSAIAHAVEIMTENDILLLAGKGHEQGQIIGTEILPFDDAQELSNALLNKQKTETR